MTDMASFVAQGSFVLLGFVFFLAGAILCAGAAIWIARFGDKNRADHTAAVAASLMTALWCALSALYGPLSTGAELAASLRNLSYIFLIFRLFAADGRHESLRPTRPLIITLAVVELFQPVLVVISARGSLTPELSSLTFEVAAALNMLVAVGALMLVHNLYAGAALSARQILRWSAAALAVFFAYELNVSTVAYLAGEQPKWLIIFQGIAGGALAGLLAFGSNSNGASLNFRPSRKVAFQTLSLLVIASYFLTMVLVTRSLTLIGGDIARASQIVFLVIGSVLAIIWLPSTRARSWLRVTAAKHFFQHRYDYREEWLRFNRTIGHAGSESASIHKRAIQAMADITESPAGLLLVPGDGGQLELSARWKWATIEVPAVAGRSELVHLLERHNHILDLDEARAGVDHHGELSHVPEWLTEAEDVWALVPLVHFDRIVGAVVLARPLMTRSLDWEDFDLLRVVGQQLASYLAEQSGQQALMDASRFDEFNRRMAFVMHDIKNLASQLSLLASNAQKHAENPEFRADMLVTLRNSSDKLNALLTRLGRYGANQPQSIQDVDLRDIAKTVEQRYRDSDRVRVTSFEMVSVLADREGLEQALAHLVQNALDASEESETVFISVSSDGLRGQIEVIDSGSGMSPEFVRSGLFKPFVSSKDGGFGIGAFEARELVKAMGGNLFVESREGIGTRFSIRLPIAEAARLINVDASDELAQNREVA